MGRPRLPLRPEDWPPFVRALAAAAEGTGLRVLPDANSTDIDGIYAIPTAVEAKTRVSAPRAYLTEAVRRRPNLNLITETEATAILFEERKAVGAAIRRADGSGDALRANTVIVSAGAIHSPPC